MDNRTNADEKDLINEDDFLAGLLTAAEGVKNDRALIRIKRFDPETKQDKEIFSFKIRVLTEKEMEEIRERHRTYKHNPRTGQKVVEDFNNARFTSEMIYLATVPEERDKLWAHPALKSKYNVMSNIDMVDVILKPGEKESVGNIILRLSGYNVDEKDEGIEILKN